MRRITFAFGHYGALFAGLIRFGPGGAKIAVAGSASLKLDQFFNFFIAF